MKNYSIRLRPLPLSLLFSAENGEEGDDDETSLIHRLQTTNYNLYKFPPKHGYPSFQQPPPLTSKETDEKTLLTGTGFQKKMFLFHNYYSSRNTSSSRGENKEIRSPFVLIPLQ